MMKNIHYKMKGVAVVTLGLLKNKTNRMELNQE